MPERSVELPARMAPCLVTRPGRGQEVTDHGRVATIGAKLVLPTHLLIPSLLRVHSLQGPGRSPCIRQDSGPGAGSVLDTLGQKQTAGNALSDQLFGFCPELLGSRIHLEVGP